MVEFVPRQLRLVICIITEGKRILEVNGRFVGLADGKGEETKQPIQAEVKAYATDNWHCSAVRLQQAAA